MRFLLAVMQPGLFFVFLASLALAEPVRFPLTVARNAGTGRVRRASDVSFNINSDSYYSTTVQIGTPSVAYQLALEMQSPFLFLSGSSCSVGCPAGSPSYDPAKSTSGLNLSVPVSVDSYGTNITGDGFSEVVNFGDFSDVKTAIIRVNRADSDSLWLLTPMSGTLGLGGSPSDAPNADIILFRKIFEAQPALQPEFSFWLKGGTAGIAVDGGDFLFGGVDSSLYSGAIDFVDTLASVNGVLWTVGISKLTVEGNSVELLSGSTTALVDINTFGIAGPAAAVEAFWGNVARSKPLASQTGMFQFPCTTQINMTMAFGGKSWTIDPADLVVDVTGTDTGFCAGAVYSGRAQNGYQWALGPAFLKSVYSVYRPTAGQIGFAELSTKAGGNGTAAGIVPAGITAPEPPASSANPSAIFGQSTIPAPSASQPSTPASTSQNSGSGSKSNTAAIAGGAAGGAVVLIAGAIVAWLILRRRNKPQSEPEAVLPPPTPFVVTPPPHADYKSEEGGIDAATAYGSTPPSPLPSAGPQMGYVHPQMQTPGYNYQPYQPYQPQPDSQVGGYEPRWSTGAPANLSGAGYSPAPGQAAPTTLAVGTPGYDHKG